MTSVPLMAVSFLMNAVMVIWVLVAVLLILVVLVQKGRGGGIGAAFGGAGAGSVLGTKTGDFLTWVTIGLVAVFLGLGLVMVKFYRPAPSATLQQSSPTLAPAAPEAPAGTSTEPESAPMSEPTEGTTTPPEPAPTGGGGGS